MEQIRFDLNIMKMYSLADWNRLVKSLESGESYISEEDSIKIIDYTARAIKSIEMEFQRRVETNKRENIPMPPFRIKLRNSNCCKFREIASRVQNLQLVEVG